MQRDNDRTYIYMSTACWKDREREPLTMSEQTAICREFMRNHPELKKLKTFHDRAMEKEPSRELYQLLEEVEHRKADCIVVASIRHFFCHSGEARYYLTRIMLPAGLRLIAIRENFDSAEQTDRKVWNRLFGKEKTK